MKLSKIGIVSTFPPTQCGIATYATDLINHLNHQYPFLNICQFELVDDSENAFFSNFSKIRKANPEDYLKASEYINSSDIDLLDIQHEFKIYGKPDGENIRILLDKVKKPIVTTLHTVNPEQSSERENMFGKIVQRSDLLFVFSEEAKRYIVGKFKVETEKVTVIPHGTPSIPFCLPNEIEERQHCPDDLIFISTGHMRSTKGYEIAIKALFDLQTKLGSFQYYIVGANHPQNESAQNYRAFLTDLIYEYGLNERVTFINNYLSLRELIDLVQLSDVCLLPYTNEQQSSSGVLALMIACGRPVVATPFQFATSRLSNKSGVITKTFHTEDFSKGIESLIKKRNSWEKMMHYNHTLGQSWNWGNVARQYYRGYDASIAVS
jgi:glycosyltransferase involved in cell wall biosynthesis